MQRHTAGGRIWYGVKDMINQASIRTSSSHPLRVDTVDVGEAGGIIGMTLCPGRRDSLSIEGTWERNLSANIATVSAWEPALVISLVEDFEFALLGVPSFAVAMLESNLSWRLYRSVTPAYPTRRSKKRGSRPVTRRVIF